VQPGLGGGDPGGQLRVPGRLPGVPAQPVELPVQHRLPVRGPRQVGLGGAQLGLGLFPARVQAGEAGRFVQQPAPLLRAGGDQGSHLPLPDHRRGACAAREVGE